MKGRLAVLLFGVVLGLFPGAASAGTPNWLPLRSNAKVGCVKTNCFYNGAYYHGYWAIDFLDPERLAGDPIYAAGSGTVIGRGFYNACLGENATNAGISARGNWIEIDHGSNVRTRYFHLKSVLVSVGQLVSSKTKIGTMGNTGRSTCSAPHLHYEKLVNGVKSDPGTMYACHGSKKVGYSNWNASKGMTVHSDGADCVARWYLRNYNSAGSPSFPSFTYGQSTDRPVVGNWDGVGGDTVGVFRSGTWYLRNYNSAGSSSISFGYGNPTDRPVVGNWDGVGGDTVGVFRSGTWYLRNYNSAGSPSFPSFTYGQSTDIPVVGDWNGDGIDTVGVFRGGSWYLRNSNSSGAADIVFSYGNPTDRPVVGNWDGVGGDTVGVFRSGTWYLRNYNSAGPPSIASFGYGLSSDRPLAGNWDGVGGDTIGVFRP